MCCKTINVSFPVVTVFPTTPPKTAHTMSDTASEAGESTSSGAGKVTGLVAARLYSVIYSGSVSQTPSGVQFCDRFAKKKISPSHPPVQTVQIQLLIFIRTLFLRSYFLSLSLFFSFGRSCSVWTINYLMVIVWGRLIFTPPTYTHVDDTRLCGPGVGPNLPLALALIRYDTLSLVLPPHRRN